MKHQLMIKQCELAYYNDIEMVSALVEDVTDHVTYKVSEWVINHDHVNKRDSYIYDQEMVPDEILKDVLDLLNIKIHELNEKIAYKKANRFLPKIYKIFFH